MSGAIRPAPGDQKLAHFELCTKILLYRLDYEYSVNRAPKHPLGTTLDLVHRVRLKVSLTLRLVEFGDAMRRCLGMPTDAAVILRWLRRKCRLQVVAIVECYLIADLLIMAIT